MNRCLRCNHPDHMHTGTGCAANNVTGPPSMGGRRVGDGYDHIGRTVTVCDCPRFAVLAACKGQ